jgi:hypothetical protein
MEEKKYPELTPEILVWFIVVSWLLVIFNLVALL